MGKGSAKKTPTSGSKPKSPSGSRGSNGKVSITKNSQVANLIFKFNSIITKNWTNAVWHQLIHATSMVSSLMLLSHIRFTRTDLFAHSRWLIQHFIQKLESKNAPRLWSTRRDSRTSQSCIDSVISSEFTEPTWECTRAPDNSTSTSTTNHHGLFTPPINLHHSDSNNQVMDHTLSLAKKPLKRDKTKLSSKLCSNGPMASSLKPTLAIAMWLNWRPLPKQKVILMSLPRFSKSSNLMNIPMNSNSEMAPVKSSTPWRSNWNSHISDKEPWLELDQPHSMRPPSTKKFLCSNTTRTSWPSWAHPSLPQPSQR